MLGAYNIFWRARGFTISCCVTLVLVSLILMQDANFSRIRVEVGRLERASASIAQNHNHTIRLVNKMSNELGILKENVQNISHRNDYGMESRMRSCNYYSVRKCTLDTLKYMSMFDEWPKMDPAFWKRFEKVPTELIDWNGDEQLSLWHRFKQFNQSFPRVGATELSEGTLTDAMIMHLQPSTIIEIGPRKASSISNKALAGLQDGVSRKHIRIDKFGAGHGHAQAGTIPLVVMKRHLQEVEPSLFLSLRSKDIVQINTSHVIQPFGDTVLEFTFILPQLPVGVVVHLEDIFLPFDYPEEWRLDPRRSHFTKQWVVAAFLHANSKWKVSAH
mmetsp:Transcript_21362/g.58700  ORF Transcript_21362/g.58700 Transcript_21362/m.58700 type:complete len:331 (-) Transcript_21362:60-1052(-)